MWIKLLLWLIFFMMLIPYRPAWSQYEQDQVAEFLDNLPEEVLEQLEDHVGMIEDLTYLSQNPLDLNTASKTDLQALARLNPADIHALLLYRDSFGPIIHINELQVVNGFSFDKIQQIAPFVEVRPGSERKQEGAGYVLVRSDAYLPRRMGFRSTDDQASPYESGPFGLLVKWRKYHTRRFSWGGSLELDAGEKFNFSGQPGFDHIHFHYYKTDRPGWLKTWTAGDYRISLGQGLLQYQGFAVTKSSNPLIVKRVSPVIQPYTGTSEYYYLRGGAVEIATNPDLRQFLFMHYQKRDATLRWDDFNDQAYFSAFKTDGYHRTPSEKDKRRKVGEFIAGHRLQWSHQRSEIGLNTIFHQFSIPYKPISRIDNLHRLNGKRLMGHSLDFGGYLGNVHVFGEVATQNYRFPAFMIAALFSLHSKLDGGVLIRRYPSYYAPIYANAFSARTLPNNESGIYIGLNYHLGPYSRISLYLDSWKGLWPTFVAHGPTFDQDVYFRVELARKRQWEAYGQLKFRHRGTNSANVFPVYQTIHYRNQLNLRLQFRKIAYQKWRWTNRLEMNWVHPQDLPKEWGVMGFSDLLWSEIGKSVSLSLRLAYFHTQSYLSRVYSYEPDILYSFSIPAFYGQGWRFALRSSYRFPSGLRIEMRTGWTWQPGEDEVGSGHNAVPGPISQQLKLQLMYKF